MSRIFDHDFADDDTSAERRKSKDRHMHGWRSFPIYALIMVICGYVAGIALFGFLDWTMN